MSHIFLSYSHKDGGYAHQLAQKLEQFGCPVWIDDRINYGAKWKDKIQENLDTCAVFIVIMTPSAYQSTWVQNELAHAQRLGKLILPLFLEGDSPWLAVESIQYTDVRNGDFPPERFFEQVKQELGKSEVGSTASTKV